jgi:hypothetical protein
MWVLRAGGLNVYKSDGVTLLGKYLGAPYDATKVDCDRIIYSDKITNTLTNMRNGDCRDIPTYRWSYAQSNCAGTPYIWWDQSWPSKNYNQACFTAGAKVNIGVASTRNDSGACTNWSGVSGDGYPCTSLDARICGNEKCQIK